MDVSCPYCGRSLRSDEDLAGREVLCPGCQTTFRAPNEESAVVAELPVKTAPPAATDDYFAEGASLPPPPPLPRIGRSEDEDDDWPEEEIRPSRRPLRWRPNLFLAEEKVRGPAIALMVFAGIGIVLGLLNPIVQLAMFGFNTGAPMAMDLIIACVTGVVSAAYNGYIFWAAREMKHLRRHGHAFAAAILTILPCFSPCCLVGIPLGIWALRVISDPDIKSAFS
jgi:uncharacterized membrane protein YphA (DoxX/SURF4 family)